MLENKGGSVLGPPQLCAKKSTESSEGKKKNGVVAWFVSFLWIWKEIEFLDVNFFLRWQTPNMGVKLCWAVSSPSFVAAVFGDVSSSFTKSSSAILAAKIKSYTTPNSGPVTQRDHLSFSLSLFLLHQKDFRTFLPISFLTFFVSIPLGSYLLLADLYQQQQQ